MINIITVNWNSYDFLHILIESLEYFSSLSYELIVVDNSTNFEPVHAENVHVFPMHRNIGHGRGINNGIEKAYNKFSNNKYIMVLDVDSHIISHNWEKYFLDEMKNYDIIGGRGVSSKPLRPACMFMKKEIAKKYDWNSTLNYKGHRKTPEGYDVAILAYHKMMADRVKLGFLERKDNHYGTLNGEEWCINNHPLVYHHWHGTHLKERSVDFPDVDLLQDKQKMFSKIPWRNLI